MTSKKKTELLEVELKNLDNKRIKVKEQLSRDRLEKITNDIVTTISSPKFMKSMKLFREKAKEKDFDLAEAGNIMSIESLKAAGASIPDDFRLTSRVFEDSELGIRMKIDHFDPLKGIGDTLAVGACGGAGGLTFCGCAGGSSS